MQYLQEIAWTTQSRDQPIRYWHSCGKDGDDPLHIFFWIDQMRKSQILKNSQIRHPERSLGFITANYYVFKHHTTAPAHKNRLALKIKSRLDTRKAISSCVYLNI